MNERIKELELEAAYGTIDPNGPFTADEFNQFTKKFAELIVKDCARSVAWYTLHHHAGVYRGQTFSANETILERFGIE